MAKKVAKIQFTEEEVKRIQQTVHHVWDEIAYDVLQGVADEKGKDINAVTVSRAVAIEVALDADRAKEEMRHDMYLAEKAGRSCVITKDLLERLDALDYKALIKLVKPAFPYSRYGM